MTTPFNCSQYNNDSTTCKAQKAYCSLSDNNTCNCAPGLGSQSKSGNDCTPCTGNQYKNTPDNSQCAPCPFKQAGEKNEGDLGNTKCACAAGYKLNNSDCTPCTGNQYKADIGNSTECLPCAGGKVGAPAEGSPSGVTGQTGPNTRCVDPSSPSPSSASPLAIALICGLIISIIASLAAAAVTIKRKMTSRSTQAQLCEEQGL